MSSGKKIFLKIGRKKFLLGKNIPARKNFCSEKYFVQKIFARKKFKKKNVLGKKIFVKLCSEK